MMAPGCLNGARGLSVAIQASPEWPDEGRMRHAETAGYPAALKRAPGRPLTPRAAASYDHDLLASVCSSKLGTRTSAIRPQGALLRLVQPLLLRIVHHRYTARCCLPGFSRNDLAS